MGGGSGDGRVPPPQWANRSVELPPATVNLVAQRHKRNALARKHLPPHRNPNVQTQQAEAGARKKI